MALYENVYQEEKAEDEEEEGKMRMLDRFQIMNVFLLLNFYLRKESCLVFDLSKLAYQILFVMEFHIRQSTVSCFLPSA